MPALPARLVALDGSKFRAAASAKRITGPREIAQEAAHLDRRITDYLAGLDEGDDGEPNEALSATACAYLPGIAKGSSLRIVIGL